MSFSDFSLPEFKMPDIPDMPNSKQLVPSVDGHRDKDIVYRWNDSKGNIHFATEPPVDGIKYSVKGYDPNANVIQAVKPPEIEKQAQPIVADATDRSEQNSPPDLESAYNKDDILKLFEDSTIAWEEAGSIVVLTNGCGPCYIWHSLTRSARTLARALNQGPGYSMNQ